VAIKFPKLYISVDYYLLRILRKSIHFRSPHSWLGEIIQRPRFGYSDEIQELIKLAVEKIRQDPSLGLNNVHILQDDPHHNYISCVKDNCLYIPKSQIELEIQLLQKLDATFNVKHAVQMVAFRWKSSEFCIQLL